MKTSENKFFTIITKCAMAKAFHQCMVCGAAKSGKMMYYHPERSACVRWRIYIFNLRLWIKLIIRASSSRIVISVIIIIIIIFYYYELFLFVLLLVLFILTLLFFIMSCCFYSKKNSNLARCGAGSGGRICLYKYITLISTNKINLKLHSILKSLYTR